jgi:hypothetical protein
MANACSEGSTQDAQKSGYVSAVGGAARTNRDADPRTDSRSDQVALIGAPSIDLAPADFVDASALEPNLM